jgi:hypothetical protein
MTVAAIDQIRLRRAVPPELRIQRGVLEQGATRFRLLVLACGLAIGPMLLASSSPWIEVRMTMNETNFRSVRIQGDGVPDAQMRPLVSACTARCVIGPDGWLIEQHIANMIRIYYLDGGDVLSWLSITGKVELPEAWKKRWSKARAHAMEGGPDTNWIFLAISPGRMPMEDIGVQLPWFAFGSGGYLREPGRRVPLLGQIIRATPGVFGFRDETETFPDELGLPKKVDLVASAKLFAKALSHESLIRVGRSPSQIRAIVNEGSGLREGALEASYRVVASTNYNGLIIPTLFTYEEFEARAGLKPGVTLTVVGRVDSIEPSAKPELVLVAGQRYSVSDNRFRHPGRLVDQISYAVTNGQIPPKDDPGLQRLFEKAVAAAPLDPVRKVHWALYVTFVALAAGPIIGLLASRRNRKRICPMVNIGQSQTKR